MRIVALLALRNEAVYLPVCLSHLAAQGIETCVIDNGSTDQSREIVESYRDQGVFKIIEYPYAGFYDWAGLLKLKEQLAATIQADWFIHHDADEIREAPRSWSTLAEGIAAADRDGYNAINFDEFVFVPTHNSEDYAGTDFVSSMHYCYFFEPLSYHRVNAWKKCASGVDLVSTAGHQAIFADRRITPEVFVLRHYMFLSIDHCLRKYTKERTYSKREVDELGWHGWRARLTAAHLRLPTLAELKRPDAGYWDKSDPSRSHRFLHQFS
jgi:glycosyltransferase involved in cell wall biosynthesis